MKLPTVPIPRVVLLSNMSRDLDANRYLESLKVVKLQQVPTAIRNTDTASSVLAGDPQKTLANISFEDEVLAKWDNQQPSDKFKEWRKLCVMLWP